MKLATQISLIDRILGYVDNRSTDMVENSYQQAVEGYLSTELLEKEKNLFFRKYPMIIGHSSQVANSGDYLSHNETGVPIVVLRTDEGTLNAFINVCRHRGMRLVNEPCGIKKKSFVCPYHAWTYNQEGKLIHLPHQEGFPCTKLEETQLIKLPVVEKFGFIWVSPSPDVELDIDSYLGNLVEDFTSYGFDTHISYQPHSKKKALNWKLGIEIFLEGYHVKHAHRNTIYPMFIDNVGIYDQFGLHMRNIFPKRRVIELKPIDKERWNIRPVANILYYLFPNSLILVEPDHATLFNIFPIDINNSIMLVNSLLPAKPETEKAVNYWQKNIDILTNATEEDFWMGEAIQKGLESGANKCFTYGRYEQSLMYFHNSLTQELTKAADTKF